MAGATDLDAFKILHFHWYASQESGHAATTKAALLYAVRQIRKPKHSY